MSAFATRLFDPSAEPSGTVPVTQSPTSGGSPSLTAGDVIRAYLDDLDFRAQIGQVTREHAVNNRRSLDRAKVYGDGSARYVGFIEVIGDRPVAELIQNDLTQWLRKNPTWKSRETRRNNLKAALGCFAWAHEEGLIRYCPYRKTKKLKEPRVKRRNAKDDEAEKVWTAATESIRRILWFVDATGVRTYEARKLLWTQIRWDEGVVVLVEHKTSSQQDEPEPRIIGLDEFVLSELRRWYEQRRPNQTHVFLSERGRVWTRTNLCHRFADLRKKCGLPKDLKAYGFRHRFLTLVIKSGMSERDAADLAGHSGTATIRQYTHTNEVENIKAKSDQFAAARKTMAPGKRVKKMESLPLFDHPDAADS